MAGVLHGDAGVGHDRKLIAEGAPGALGERPERTRILQENRPDSPCPETRIRQPWQRLIFVPLHTKCLRTSSGGRC